MRNWHRLGIIVYFAAAMAWVESASVLYFRHASSAIALHPILPAPGVVGLGAVELVREASTLVMLLAVGWLAGRTPRARWGYSLVAFGAWDILYYVFLVPISGWPRSLFDWDVLFLIPLPWWGPVLAPCLVSASMIALGTLLVRWADPVCRVGPGRWSLASCGLGIALALAVFMEDALRASVAGSPPHAAPPASFDWPTFIVALVLMSGPAVDMARQAHRRAPDQPTSAIDSGARPRRCQTTKPTTASARAGTITTQANC